MESELQECLTGTRLRAAVRAAASRMVEQRFHRALLHLRPKALPKALLGIAISCALGQLAAIMVDLDGGCAEIDSTQQTPAPESTSLHPARPVRHEE